MLLVAVSKKLLSRKKFQFLTYVDWKKKLYNQKVFLIES